MLMLIFFFICMLVHINSCMNWDKPITHRKMRKMASSLPSEERKAEFKTSYNSSQAFSFTRQVLFF